MSDQDRPDDPAVPPGVPEEVGTGIINSMAFIDGVMRSGGDPLQLERFGADLAALAQEDPVQITMVAGMLFSLLYSALLVLAEEEATTVAEGWDYLQAGVTGEFLASMLTGQNPE